MCVILLIRDTFFRTICTDIFDTILLDFSGQLAQKEAEQEEEEEDNADEEEEAEDEDAEEEESTKGKGNEEEKVVDESNCAAEDENEVIGLIIKQFIFQNPN